MYKSYLKVLPTSNKGKGVFTTIIIKANKPVIEITGDLSSEENLPNPNHPALLQVAPNLFIGPSGDVDDYVNHSCDPNCLLHIVGNRAILYSMYDIQPNSEITFDYSTSSTDTLDKWKMDCQCGSFQCRKVISGLQYLDKNQIKNLNNKNMIPLFMRKNMFY